MMSEVKADPNNLILQEAGVVVLPPVVGTTTTAFTSTTNEHHHHQRQLNEQQYQHEVIQQPPMTDAMKKIKRRERLEQNRVSARVSRTRKKSMIEELQRSVINLSRENKDLQQQNEIIKRQLLDLGAKFPNAVPLHLLSTDQQFQPQAHSVGSTQQQALPPLHTAPPVAVTPTNIVTQMSPLIQQELLQLNTQQVPAPAPPIPNIVPTQQLASFPNFMTKLTEATAVTPGTMQQQLQKHQQTQQGFNF